MEPILHPAYLRALRYVALVERGGAAVSSRQLNEFIEVDAPEIGKARLLGAGLSYQLQSLMRSAYQYGEAHVDYLKRMGWVSDENGCRLTRVGRAIVAASEGEATGTETSDGIVILSPDDPLNLGALTADVSAGRAGLLVDPYFDDSLVDWLARSTSIARVLMCRREDKCDALKFYLGGLERTGRSVEFRILEPRRLHDRYLIGEDGKVSMIGASLNGLHRNFTAIIEVPSPGAEAIRAEVEARWNEASPVEPVADIRRPIPEPGTATEIQIDSPPDASNKGVEAPSPPGSPD